MDSSLHSIKRLLMEEGREDATCSQHVGADMLYHSILRSFYDIVGDSPPPPMPSLVSRSCDQTLLLTHPLSSAEEHVQYVYNGSNLSSDQKLHSGAFRGSLPVTHADYLAPSSLLLTEESAKAQVQPPSPYREFPLMLAGVELLFEDLKLHEYYAALYVGSELGISREAPNRRRLFAIGGDGGRSEKLTSSNAQECVDLKEMIVKCAEAVAVGNTRSANNILHDIRQLYGVSADGNGSQRAVHYFGEALVARMRGTGEEDFRAMSVQKPCPRTVLKFYKLWFEVGPVLQITHYFANQSILKAAEQASRLHIVDYGSGHAGLQWLFLINALADRRGGPPLLVITAIDAPQPGDNPGGRLEECGWRLATHARAHNVPFQYHAIASSKWEDLDPSCFYFQEDEVLVVNCISSLHHVADESLDSVSPRQKLLNCIYNLRPHLLVTAHVSAAYNSPFFLFRFRQALYYYSSLFDMVDSLWKNIPERLLKEKGIYFSKILNIVACEGAERVERAESYKRWEGRIKRAGFEQLEIPPAVLCRSRWYVKRNYHRDFFVHEEDNKWMLLGWRGRTAVAVSAWAPSFVMTTMQQ